MCHRSLTLCLLLLSGCAGPPGNVSDDLGRAVSVRQPVRRLVTLAPNLTEIVFAIGCGSRVVATDDFSDTPAGASALPKVGGVQPSAEAIVAARPDLVLAVSSGNNPPLASALGAASIPLYVVKTDRIADVTRVMRRVAGIIGVSGEDAASSLERRIEKERRRRVVRPRVLFVIWTEPLYVAGRRTFADDLFELTGAENAVGIDGWPQYSIESVVAAPPDIILHPGKSVQPAQLARLLAVAPQLRKCRIVSVDENLFTRPGPRMAEAAAALNRTIDAWQTSR